MENDELRHKRNEWSHNNENDMEKLREIRWRVCEDQVTD